MIVYSPLLVFLQILFNSDYGLKKKKIWGRLIKLTFRRYQVRLRSISVTS